MNLICLLAGGPEKVSIKKVIKDTGPVAIIHHGGVTDRLFREGNSREVHDFVKRVKDAGVLAGVSAHNPDCIKKVADEGWDVDLFMTVVSSSLQWLLLVGGRCSVGSGQKGFTTTRITAAISTRAGSSLKILKNFSLCIWRSRAKAFMMRRQ